MVQKDLFAGIRARLEQERASLRNDIDSLAIENQAQQDDYGVGNHVADDATEVFTRERNLALRSGVEDVDTLVAMLIQAERFGTSIGASLRVHADGLRTKRRLRAEEAAAKIALKLLFPLIFCIFPSLMLVLLGPAFIQIYRVLLPAMGGHR